MRQLLQQRQPKENAKRKRQKRRKNVVVAEEEMTIAALPTVEVAVLLDRLSAGAAVILDRPPRSIAVEALVMAAVPQVTFKPWTPPTS